MSYNIDTLLGTDYRSSPADDTGIEDVSDVSVSDHDDEISELDRSEFTPYIRKFNRKTKSSAPDDVRLRVNSRERQRMHDLNAAMDSLRQVMPYSQGPSVKKISKMSTLLLARNYIVMLNKSLEEMRRMVNELSHKQATAQQQTSTPVSVGIERLQHVTPGQVILKPQVVTPTTNFVYSADYFHGQTSAMSHLQNVYSTLKVPQPEIDHIHTSSMPCPCHFCQTSLTSLPKPKWKQAC